MPPMFLLSDCWKPVPSVAVFATPDDRGLPGGLLCLHLSHVLIFKKKVIIATPKNLHIMQYMKP